MISFFRTFISSQLVKSSSIYFIGTLISSGVPFILLPVLTRYLSPTDFGIIAIFNSLIGFLLNIAVFSQNSTYQRFYYDYDEDNTRRLMFNTVAVITAATCITGVLLGAFQFIVRYDFGFDNRWLLIIMFIVYANAIHLLILGYFQITNRPFIHLSIQSSRAILIMLIAIFLVVYKGYNWQGRVYGIFYYFLIFLPVGLGFIFFSDKFSVEISKDMIKEISFFGGGLVPGAIAGWGLNLADRLILDYYKGAAVTGLYSIGYQFGFIVFLVVTASGRAWSPYFWENWLKHGEKGKKNIFNASKYLLVGIFSTACFVSIVGPFLLRVMVTSEFYSASKYIALISFGYAVQGFHIIFSPYLSYHKKTFQMSNIAIVSVAANIILNILLIPIFGGMGAAIATVLAFLLSLIIHMILVYRLEGISVITLLKNTD